MRPGSTRAPKRGGKAPPGGLRALSNGGQGRTVGHDEEVDPQILVQTGGLERDQVGLRRQDAAGLFSGSKIDVPRRVERSGDLASGLLTEVGRGGRAGDVRAEVGVVGAIRRQGDFAGGRLLPVETAPDRGFGVETAHVGWARGGGVDGRGVGGSRLACIRARGFERGVGRLRALVLEAAESPGGRGLAAEEESAGHDAGRRRRERGRHPAQLCQKRARAPGPARRADPQKFVGWGDQKRSARFNP